MTDEMRGSPLSVDLLADLHAGVLDPAESARLWAQVNTDPQARAIIQALDSVTAGLGDLAEAPAPPMPAHFAARLDAAIEAEAVRAFSGGAQVIDLAAARRKRNKILAWGTGTLTAAAAAVAVVTVLPNSAPPPSGSVAQPNQTAAATAEAPLAVTSKDVGLAIGKIGNKKDYGPLKDQAALDKCIAANGVDAKAQTIGVHPVTLDGTPGVMALLTTGDVRKLRVLVVKPDCTALFNDTIGS